MPKMDDYECRDCGTCAEQLLGTGEQPVCAKCGSTALEKLLTGGHIFGVIIPTYPGSKQWKAGYAHKFKNKPAEKQSISVPASVERSIP